MNIPSENVLAEAFRYIEVCNFDCAHKILMDNLTSNLESDESLFASTSCTFWVEELQKFNGDSKLGLAEFLVTTWDRYCSLYPKDRKGYSLNVIYSFRKGIFSLALQLYDVAQKESKVDDAHFNAQIMRKMGLCYKRLGSYEQAVECLEKANSLHTMQPEIVAEYADALAFLGNRKYAKLLFKEAFRIDAQKIELAFLDSPLINGVIEKVRSLGVSEQATKEWVAVYGVLMGVFTVCRPLKINEYLKLQNEAYSKDVSLKNSKDEADVIKPRLINLYFWLVDYYSQSNGHSDEINEVLMKMKILDPVIYEAYMK